MGGCGGGSRAEGGGALDKDGMESCLPKEEGARRTDDAPTDDDDIGMAWSIEDTQLSWVRSAPYHGMDPSLRASGRFAGK